jgi:hypothetical protein
VRTFTKEEAAAVLHTWPVRNWAWPKVAVGVLHERAMSHADDVFPGFWGIAMNGVPLLHQDYGRTDMVRNRMAMRLLQSNFTHLLMLDVDHRHPPDIVQRLSRWVLAHPDIEVVGGLNFRRGAPFEPCCFVLGADGKYYAPSEWEEGLITVDAIGTGSIMISRTVFERMEPPWFWNDYSQVWEDSWPGEDMGFSANCRKLGIKMYVDTTTTSPHMIDAIVDESSFREYQKDNNLVTTDISNVKRPEDESVE